jgi:F0F1-type ATP synthase membrane subunit b/b'
MSMSFAPGALLLAVLVFAVQIVVLYWVIRSAVRSAIADASESLRHDIRTALAEADMRRKRQTGD